MYEHWSYHRHPSYERSMARWTRWRDTYEGGEDYIERYVEKFSTRETDADFAARKNVTYTPAFAKEAVNAVKNAIFERMTEVIRVDGPKSFLKACEGLDGGVDLQGTSMTTFIGEKILPDLLVMGRAGIYVDMPQIGQSLSVAEAQSMRPYIYFYPVEDILSWRVRRGTLVSLLLRDTYFEEDLFSGLETGPCHRYRLLKLEEDGVHVYLSNQAMTDDGKIHWKEDSRFTLKMRRIPFAMPTLTDSLIKDVCSYQIALTNLASTDMGYILKANFPFYTEQFDTRTDDLYNLGDEQQNKIDVGPAKGRRYPKDLDRPGFIHPSPEPLEISMKKQEQLRTEIRLLVNLAVANVNPQKQSAESKAFDMQSLEAGLSYIGQTLNKAEQFVAECWAEYLGETTATTIRYPEKYNMETDESRRETAKTLVELRGSVPSKTYQKEMSKLIAVKTLGTKVPFNTLQEIFKEIEQAKAMTFDAVTIQKDVETGLLSTGTAAEIRGYDASEAKKAQAERIEKAAAIVKAQAEVQGRGTDLASEQDAKGDKQLAKVRKETTAGIDSSPGIVEEDDTKRQAREKNAS